MYINGQYHYTYFISLNSDGTFKFKDEATFDDDGNELVYTVSEYINNEWVIASFRNYKNHTGCSYHLNFDGTYEAKNEYTYDDADNILTHVYSKYINGNWIITKFSDSEHNTEYSINLKSDGTYESKDEYTYDEYGGELTWTNYEYINNDWVTIKYRDYEHNTGCSFNLNPDGTYDSKDEYTDDAFGNEVTDAYIEFENDTWVYIYKNEYTYDKDRNKLTAKYSKYINRKWVVTKFEDYENNTRYSINLKADGTYDSKTEYTFLEDGATSTCTMYKYINNDWVILYFKDYEHNTIYTIDLNSDETYKSKTEYTYDDNGVLLTVTNYVYVDGQWVLKS